MSDHIFIGLGRNPDGPDLPEGLGMRLMQDQKAMETFGSMSKEQKAAVIGYIRGAHSGEEAENRMADAVSQMSDGRVQF